MLTRLGMNWGVRWRDFKTDNGASPSVGFIDGDLVERFLDISEEDPLMREIMEVRLPVLTHLPLPSIVLFPQALTLDLLGRCRSRRAPTSTRN